MQGKAGYQAIDPEASAEVQQTQVRCEDCGWTRVLTANAPRDRQQDQHDAIVRARQLRLCPQCGLEALVAEQIDLFGRVSWRQ